MTLCVLMKHKHMSLLSIKEKKMVIKTALVSSQQHMFVQHFSVTIQAVISLLDIKVKTCKYLRFLQFIYTLPQRRVAFTRYTNAGSKV